MDWGEDEDETGGLWADERDEDVRLHGHEWRRRRHRDGRPDGRGLRGREGWLRGGHFEDIEI